MKKKLLITLQLCLFLYFNFLGQENAREVDELTRARITQQEYLLNLNPSLLNLREHLNSSIIIQEQGNFSFNLVYITQKGNGNSSLVEQNGSGYTSQVIQSGYKNSVNLSASGNNVQATVIQNGEENLIISHIENHGPQTRTAELTQEGNFNKIELSLKGDGFTDPALEQRVVINQLGNAHDLTVVRDPFSTPLEITQTAGTGGVGMKVDITTSAFMLPPN